MCDMQIFTYKTIDMTISEKSGENCYELVKQQIEKTESKYKVRIIAVVSDAGGDAEKARRLLQLCRPDLLTMDCFSHQFNLSVGGKPVIS